MKTSLLLFLALVEIFLSQAALAASTTITARELLVNNSGNYATGFDAAISGTAICQVPESGSFAMVAIAGILLTGVGLGRRCSRSAA